MLCQEQPTTLLSDGKCPPWFFYNFTLDRCECFESLNQDVRCTDEGALLRFGRCMTYYYQEGIGSFVSSCPYFLVNNFIDNVTQSIFIQLPSNITEYMCGPLNRKGYQCSECFDGFGPSLTSIGYQCSNCTGVWYGVPLYLFLEFVPITIFYLTILIFRINVTSAPMTSFILFSQLTLFSLIVNTELQSVIQAEFNRGAFYFVNGFIITFYGIWNLDFFRYIIPPFCVSPNLKVIHIYFMAYISAFYPLCLIAITWIWIELLSRNFKPLVWTWKRTQRCFARANFWKLGQKAYNH